MRRATPCKLPECCVGRDVHAMLRAGRESTERVPRGRESARSNGWKSGKVNTTAGRRG